MKRAIIVPAPPAPEALAELKQWLAIASSRDDPALARLIAASLEMFEDFTGKVPLEATCEEILPATGAWQTLTSRPVVAVLAVEAVADDGSRSPLPVTARCWHSMRTAAPASGFSARSRRDGSRCASSPGWRRAGTSCRPDCATE